MRVATFQKARSYTKPRRRSRGVTGTTATPPSPQTNAIQAVHELVARAFLLARPGTVPNDGLAVPERPPEDGYRCRVALPTGPVYAAAAEFTRPPLRLLGSDGTERWAAAGSSEFTRVIGC